jgi:hypothetical protein
MSKRGEKSAAIREYIEQNPTAKAREIIDALAKRRIKVSQNQVYGLLSKSNGEAAAPKAPEAKAPESNGHPRCRTCRSSMRSNSSRPRAA